MAYGNYSRGNYGGGYNRGGYSNSQGGGQQAPTPPPSPEEYIKNKLDMYHLFKDEIIKSGDNPDEFTFGLMAWVTGYEMAQLKYEEAMKKYKGK